MYQDLGSKPQQTQAEPSTTLDKKVYYPSLHLDLDEVPDLKLGEDVEAKVKICVSGVRKNYDGKTCVDFEVKGIDFGGAEKKKETAGEKLSKMVSDDIKEMDRD